MNDRHLSLYEAASASGLPPAAMFALTNAGIVRSIHTSGGVVIPLRDLKAWARMWHRRLARLAGER